jgi:hypothetical protein
VKIMRRGGRANHFEAPKFRVGSRHILATRRQSKCGRCLSRDERAELRVPIRAGEEVAATCYDCSLIERNSPH